jgi:hypothetical protein
METADATSHLRVGQLVRVRPERTLHLTLSGGTTGVVVGVEYPIGARTKNLVSYVVDLAGDGRRGLPTLLSFMAGQLEVVG